MSNFDREPPPTRRPSPGSYTLSAVLFLVTVCGLAIVGLKIWRWPETPRTRPRRTIAVGEKRIIAFSPGGRFAQAVAPDDLSVPTMSWLYDLEPRRAAPLNDEPLQVFCFSPDGRRALVGRGREVLILELATGEGRAVGAAGGGEIFAGYVLSASFSPDGSRLLIRHWVEPQDEEGLWDGNGAWLADLPFARERRRFVDRDFLLGPDGQRLQIGADGRVAELPALDFRPAPETDAPERVYPADLLAIDRPGRQALYLTGGFFVFKHVDLDQTLGTALPSLDGGNELQVRFIPHSDLVLLADSLPVLWLMRGAFPRQWPPSRPFIAAYTRGYDWPYWRWDSQQPPLYALSPDGRRLAAVAYGYRGIALQQAADGRPIRRLVSPAKVTALAFSPDSRRLFSADWNGNVHVWDATDARPWSYLAGLLLMLVMLGAQGRWWRRNRRQARTQRRQRIDDWLDERRAAATGQPRLPVPDRAPLAGEYARQASRQARRALRFLLLALFLAGLIGTVEAGSGDYYFLGEQLIAELGLVCLLTAVASLVLLGLSFLHLEFTVGAALLTYGVLGLVLTLVAPSLLVIIGVVLVLALVGGTLLFAVRAGRAARKLAAEESFSRWKSGR